MLKILCAYAMLTSFLLCSSSKASTPSDDNIDLHKVFFPDVRNGYVLGTTNDASMIFRSRDGGVSWESSYRTELPLHGILFRSGGWPSLPHALTNSGCPILRGFLRRVGRHTDGSGALLSVRACPK